MVLAMPLQVEKSSTMGYATHDDEPYGAPHVPGVHHAHEGLQNEILQDERAKTMPHKSVALHHAVQNILDLAASYRGLLDVSSYGDAYAWYDALHLQFPYGS